VEGNWYAFNFYLCDLNQTGLDHSHHEPRILVTGGTGLIGSYLLRYLIHKAYGPVRAIYRRDSDFSLIPEQVQQQIEWVECDLLDPLGLEVALQDVSVVFHAAAIISFDPAEFNQMIRVTVTGTATLVDMALRQKVDRLLHISSVSALGRYKPGDVLTEKSTWQRSIYNTGYGLSKYQSEQEVWRGAAEGLRVSIVNPSIVLGAGRWEEGSCRFFPFIDQGFAFYPQGNSGFVDVRDVVELLLHLYENEITGQRYIANAADISYRQFFTHIAQALRVKAPRYPITPLLREISWRLALVQGLLTSKKPFITRETARQSARVFYNDNQKSREDLGFQYRDLKATIQEVAQAYRQSQQTQQLELLQLEGEAR